ncbi:substrate-binding domain-containing protein [Streptomyces sp. NPDC101225]|uniref:substrate-binding domain-containing protein n=1 Tax=Streptomyces sp. NPDC101225 TaxID=3366135 RepID=UPI0038299149
MATMADVARSAGVSVATVSHVLNDTRPVLPHTRQAVLDAIDLLGYTPNTLARSLVTSRTRSIGLAVSAISNPYFTEILQGVEAAALAQGYSLLIADPHDDPVHERKVVQLLHERRVDGMIVAPSADPRELVAYLGRHEVPAVFLDRLVDIPAEGARTNGATSEDTHAEGAPEGGTPAEDAHAGSAPHGRTPAEGTGAGTTPHGSTPGEDAHAGTTPHSGTPAEDTHAGTRPHGRTPAEDTRAGSAPHGRTPAEGGALVGGAARYDQVCAESAEPTARLVAHLAELGHHRIGLVAGLPGLSTTGERIAGYRQGLAGSGLPYQERLVAHGDSESTGAERATAELLSLTAPPTALVTANNTMTIGALRALRNRGLSVPRDLALCCFDDFAWADLFSPRLTAVAQPSKEIGALAVRVLLERLASPGRPVRTLRLPCTFVHRSSCGCPEPLPQPEKGTAP